MRSDSRSLLLGCIRSVTRCRLSRCIAALKSTVVTAAVIANITKLRSLLLVGPTYPTVDAVIQWAILALGLR